MKLASKVRQEVNLQAAQDLLAKVQKIAEIFWKSKGADTKRQPSLQKAGGELVYPSPK
jgi:nickel superoxide dismutase